MKTLRALIISLLILAPLTASAQVAPPPGGSPPGAEWTANVDVQDHCTVTDSDGVSHSYSGQYLGICALKEALDAGSISSVVLSNAFPSIGLYLTTINGIFGDYAVNGRYWAMFVNGGYASSGLTQLAVVSGDSLVIELHDSSDVYQNYRLTITINSLVATTAPVAVQGTGGGGVWMHPPFDVPAAFAYLASVQSADGSFGSPMLSDWASIAAAVESGPVREKLIAYQKAYAATSSVITEMERHAMALQALGINPYSGTPVDYITPIVLAFDGTQIGDPNLVNDDIFAIFPLLHAGYSTADPIIASTEAFIIAKQGADGSWASSVDLTAAAIQALALMPDTGDTRYAISKAVGYLRGKQKTDGSFGDPFSTSWMIQAIAAMNGTTADWQQRIYTPDYFLATKQDADGSVIASSTSDRIWATAYAIPAIRRATWDSLLASFPKYAPPIAAAAEATTSVAATQDAQSGPILKVASVDAAQTTPSIVPTASAEAPTPETLRPADATSSQSAAAAAASALDENWLFLVVAFLVLLGYCGLAYRSIRKRS